MNLSVYNEPYFLPKVGNPHPSSPTPTIDPKQVDMMMKLVMLSGLSAVGTIGNVFAVSAVMLDDHLKKKGNVFIVNLAIADFMVSAFAIPANSVTILAGNPDDPNVCHIQWMAAILCCHISILTLMFAALENHSRILSSADQYERLFGKSEIGVAVALTWIVAIVCVACQFSLNLGPDYCRMIFKGHVFYHLLVGTFLFCIPTVVAFSAYLRCMFALKDTKSLEFQNALLTSRTLAKDVDLMKTNFLVFLVFLAFWFPLGIAIAIGSIRPISRKLYEHLSWLALSNSCINSFIYGIKNRYFRSTFTKLFHYCFCKTSVSFGRMSDRPSSMHSRGCLQLMTADSIGVNGASISGSGGCGMTNNVKASSSNTIPTFHHGAHHSGHTGLSSYSHGNSISSTRPPADVRVHIIPGYNIYAAQRRVQDANVSRDAVRSNRNTCKEVYEL
ncbi:hypothetical protein CHUAL_003693 [Chamberlinius hualienensis]